MTYKDVPSNRRPTGMWMSSKKSTDTESVSEGRLRYAAKSDHTLDALGIRTGNDAFEDLALERPKDDHTEINW